MFFGYVINYLLIKIKKRDGDHITGKQRGSAHSNRNITFKLTKNVLVIFHNSRSYDGHLIMQEIDKFSADINAISLKKKILTAYNL